MWRVFIVIMQTFIGEKIYVEGEKYFSIRKRRKHIGCPRCTLHFKCFAFNSSFYKEIKIKHFGYCGFEKREIRRVNYAKI